MIKKMLSYILGNWMVLSLVISAWAAESTVIPTPPPWVPEEEYLVLEYSKAYESDLWNKIVMLRADAQAGNLQNTAKSDPKLKEAAQECYQQHQTDAGTEFEYGLIQMQYLANTGFPTVRNVAAEKAFERTVDMLKESGGRDYEVARLWFCRARILASSESGKPLSGTIVKLLQDCESIRPEQVLDTTVLQNKDVSQLEALQQAVESEGERLPIPAWFYKQKDEAGAADKIIEPYPPAWIPANEYLICDMSEIYQEKNWNKVLALRNYAADGGTTPLPEDLARTYAEVSNIARSGGEGGYQDDAACVEMMLIQSKLYGNNGMWDKGSSGSSYATYLRFSAQEQDDIVALWRLRFSMLPGASRSEFEERYLDGALRTENFTIKKLLDTPVLSAMPEEKRQRLKSFVFVRLDEGYISTIESPRSGRTMLPMRRLAEKLGAAVEWDGKTQTVTLRRAGDEIRMTLGSTTAYRNSVPFIMDVAPFEQGGSTYLPVRFVGELLGQKVIWSSEKQTVDIVEDKSVVANSNLEAWALPMGSLLNSLNEEADPALFGGWPRSYERYVYTSFVTASKLLQNSLRSAWDITDREELMDTVRRMTEHGHNDSFKESVAFINSMSEAEYRTVLDQAQGADKYMFPYTKKLDQKWGDRGIMCWDLFRMSNLVQWGYCAGYVSYAEALALVEPAARKLKDNFSSWDEAYENYLDGYNWWARSDVLEQNIWETERGLKYKELRQDGRIGTIYDDSLFRKEIISVPGLSTDSLAG